MEIKLENERITVSRCGWFYNNYAHIRVEVKRSKEVGLIMEICGQLGADVNFVQWTQHSLFSHLDSLKLYFSSVT